MRSNRSDKSCFRDLPANDAECPRCRRAERPASSSKIVGLLLFLLVMAGLLTFDRRLTAAAAAMAVILIAVQIRRLLRQG